MNINIFTDPLHRVTWFSLLNILIWTTILFYLVKWLKGRKKTTVLIMFFALFFTSCKKEQGIIKPAEQQLHFTSKVQADAWLEKVTATRTFATAVSPLLDSAIVKTGVIEKNIDAAPHEDDPGPTPSGSAMLVEVFLWAGHSVGFSWSILGSSANGSGSTPGTNGAEHGNGCWWIKDIVADLVGITPGVTFKQTQATWRNYPNSYLIYFEVQGTENYAVFVNGIGVYNQFPMVITGTYNIKTREYTLTSRSTKPAITP